MKTAILVDGGFYNKKMAYYRGKRSAKESADYLFDYCAKHLEENGVKSDLYRIFYYDCPPFKDKLFHPLTKQQIDFSATSKFEWTTTFINELKNKRKVAIRLGYLSGSRYGLREQSVKNLLNGELRLEDLKESDFEVNFQQKCVDMKIGLDIASMAFKKQVEQIVLIAGDSDFIPAAKLARREGIDFVLDPLGQHIKDELNEHIDGIRSFATFSEDRAPSKAKVVVTENII